jgi:predicted DsbA family dithiol-disulfide isomerase
MFFQTSRRIRLKTVIEIWTGASFWLLLLGTSVLAQAPETVLASVNGSEITLKQVDESVAAQVYPLQQQLYAIRKAALENLLIARVLENEATTRGVSIDELRRQLTLGEISVSRAQVEEAYIRNASFFATMSPDEARERLRLDLENQARMKHYRAGLEALRKKWTSKLNFALPAVFSELDDGISPAEGSTNAAVTIVAFSDFECRYCRDVHVTLKQVMQSYGRHVRLVFKHLPLEGHRNSLPAARAAYCAGEQDRFWQFHDALFASEQLSAAVFDEIAAELGLGMQQFRACQNSEHSRSAVIKDLELARLFRIESTPSFIVNGKLIKGALSFSDFQKVIERELNESASKKQFSN